MKRACLTLLLLCTTLLTFATTKPKVMWLDCSANFERFSYPDSIRYYVGKCHEAGITHLVLDIKDNTGEVLYDSKYTSRKRTWKGFTRPDFDFINTFISEAHKRGMVIFAGMNIFADGSKAHGQLRGAVFGKNKKWQSINYVPGKGLIPVTELNGKTSMFLNPALKDVQRHEINIVKEVVKRFKFDGIMLDRARYDCIESDFSEASRTLFEKYIGQKLNRYPEDIYEWKANDKGTFDRVPGPYYKKWIEWRASVIYGFIKDVRTAIKKIDSQCMLASYTGAWYPTYYEVGVNWASNKYDPSKEFPWATPEYRKYGYAELIDFYTNGNYYKNVTIDDYYKSSGLYKNETDSEASSGEYLCVEGGCKYTRQLLQGAKPFYGGLYVEDYRKNSLQFQKAVRMNLKESDGVMIFDIVHIILYDWWKELKEALDEDHAPNPHELYGAVTCEGKGVPNVVVTDGKRCVTTDKNGVYRIPNVGDTRFVYISTPAGFLTETNRGIPLFYQEIDHQKQQMEYNFKLKKNPKDDSKHIAIVEADVQANSKEHWLKYGPVVDDYRKLLASTPDKDAFGLSCGDICWDTPTTFFEDYMRQAERINLPFYRVIGNHDMDYNGRTHETSYRSFETHFGPSCYSFNKGNAHYIVINNCFYVGRQYFYVGYIDENTFKWLEQDLSYVPKGTVVFVAAHIPFRSTVKEQPFVYTYEYLGGETINAESLFKLLEGYESHFLTGHMHTNSNVIFNNHQMEHNIGAVCGTWWHAPLCLDGTPQGCQVFEMDGKKVSWYYKSTGYPKTYQFRAYAPGTVKEYPKDIIANVWNYDDQWKVEWLENGKPMGVMTQYTGLDPAAVKMVKDNRKTMQSWIAPLPTKHMFRATPRYSKSKLAVRVTDRFGNVYQEEITRK